MSSFDRFSFASNVILRFSPQNVFSYYVCVRVFFGVVCLYHQLAVAREKTPIVSVTPDIVLQVPPMHHEECTIRACVSTRSTLLRENHVLSKKMNLPMKIEIFHETIWLSLTQISFKNKSYV